MSSRNCGGRLLLLLAALVAAPPRAAGAPSPQCQLNGELGAAGACACKPAWRGADCGELSLLPANRSAGLQMRGNSTWGGAVLRGADGRWHMFVSLFLGGCGLAEWQPNSAIARATSDSAGGSFELAEVIVPNFAHEPDARVLPDGSVVVFFISNASAPLCTKCSGGVSTPGCNKWTPGTRFFGPWSAISAPSVLGPWTEVRLGSCEAGAPDEVPNCHSNGNDINPSVIVGEGSAVTMMWRSIDFSSRGQSYVALATAPSWRGPFSYNTSSLFPQLSGQHIEDPFAWRSRDGTYHALLHADFDGCCGGAAGVHAWSADGVSWSISPRNAYNNSVELVGGGTLSLQNRERPHLVLDEDSGEPTHLTNAAALAGDTSDKTFTFIQPIATSTTSTAAATAAAAAAAAASAAAAEVAPVAEHLLSDGWLRIHIVGSDTPPPLARLAARQLRRFLHALDRRLPPATFEPPAQVAASAAAVVIFLATATASLDVSSPLAGATRPAVGADFALSLLPGGSVAIVGADDRGIFDGATSLLGALGVRFTAEGALLPPAAAARARRAQAGAGGSVADAAERADAAKRMAATLAGAAAKGAAATPAFQYRGFQPWGSYPMGNDWWDVDEYRRVIELIVGLRGNWIGMHSYPRGYSWPEPGVAVLADTSALLPSGNVSAAPYAASWAATMRPSWGNDGAPSGAYCCGAAALFEADCVGNFAVAGDDPALCPIPSSPEAEAETWNRVGSLYQQTFAFARALNVSTALGTEIPLTMPPQPPDSLVPLFVWWSAARNDTFVTPTQCAECPPGAYELLGVAGFIFSAPGPGRVALNCYWAPDYLDALLSTSPPADAAYTFVRLEGYALAAPAAGAMPLAQEARLYDKSALGGGAFVDTWAVSGPEWLANASARGYAPTAASTAAAAPLAWVMESGPAPGAALLAAYNATFSRLERLYGENLTWWMAEGWQWSKVKQDDPLVSGVLADVAAIEQVRESLRPSFGLALGGWQLGPYDNRSYFDARLPADWPMASLDPYQGGVNCAPAPACGAPDPGFFNVTHRAQRWSHPWAEDDQDLTAMQLWVGRNLQHAAEALALGVTGLMSLQWRTRTVAPQLTAVADFAFNASLDGPSFWRGYAQALFGPSIADAAAEILISVDSYALPRPVNCDPGCLQPSAAACTWATEYSFVDAWLALNTTLLRALAAAAEPGGDCETALADAANFERFEWFSANFLYMRGMRRAECDWFAFNGVLASLQAMEPGPAREAAAVARGFPALASLAANLTRMVYDQVATISTYGELAVTTQVLSSVDSAMSGAAQLAALAGGVPLPQNCSLARTWDASRSPLLRVLTARTILLAGEPFNLRALVVDGAAADGAAVAVSAFTRPAGSRGAFSETPLLQAPPSGGVARSVYAASLPAPAHDTEWYLQATRGEEWVLFFPPDAPALPATVVILET